MREKHTCLNGVEWLAAAQGGGSAAGAVHNGMGGQNSGSGPAQMSNDMNAINRMGTVEIRQDEAGNIVGGARVLGPVDPRPRESVGGQQQIAPVLPKVQRNSASRLPFLMDILPRLMNITRATTPAEIRDCLLREYGAEVHLQQCRRAKTEILKKRAAEAETERGPDVGQPQGQNGGQQSLDRMSSEGANSSNQQLFGDMNGSPSQSPHTFTLHTAQGVVTPVMADRSTSALRAVGEAPVRCPYCINHRWMRSIKDAVEHMSMHVVV